MTSKRPKVVQADDDGAFDRRMMRWAIALSKLGEGFVEPNPAVGCVIARGQRVLGEGYHHRFGEPHAEVEALKACSEDTRGATAYVTLEPCAHEGKTPPCTKALIDAGIGRVVAAVGDPYPRVKGRGFRALRRAGIEVETGLLAEEAAAVLAPFLVRVRKKRPYVIAKWAQSLDGRLATRTGDSRWISTPASRRLVHRLRARVDAILVGVGTVLADDPMLTARDVPLRRRAMRVVLDSRLRIPPKCQLVGTAREVPTLVLTGRRPAASPRAEALRRRGVEVLGCAGGIRGRRWPAVLRMLADREVTNLMVEGGGTILTSLLDARLVDEAWVFTAPLLIGGDAPGPMQGRGARRMATAVRPWRTSIRRVGDDVLHRLFLTNPLPLAT